MDREREADLEREREKVLEAEEEQRIREQRRTDRDPDSNITPQKGTNVS